MLKNMTEAGIVLKVNIKEIIKLKEVAKHLDEIKAKATAFDAVKNKVPKAKKEIKKLNEAQKELLKRTKETENAFKSMSTKAIAVCIKLRKQIEKNGIAMKTFSSRIANARKGMIMWGARTAEMSKRIIGFGKNIQWTGRQLMMGFTLPIAYASITAVKAAMDIEASWIRVRKVYGDTIEEANSFAQIQKDVLIPAIEHLSLTFAEHKKDVVDVMAEWAAMGWTGKALADIVQETFFYMTAGSITAAKATEYLRSVVAIFSLTVEDTRYAMAQLNAIENATAATMEDLGEALSRVGVSAASVNLTVAETGALLSQMRNAGVRATTAGMSLKFIIKSMVMPTSEANKKINAFSKSIGLGEMSMKSSGFQSLKFIDKLKKLAEIYDKLEGNQKTQMAAFIAGARQYSRFETILKGMNDELSAFSRSMEVSMDPNVVKKYLQEIMTVLESAPMTWKRLQVSIENLAASWGDIVSEKLKPIVNWLIGLTTALKQLDPAIMRNIFYVTTFLAVLGPVLMYIGFTTQAIMILVQAFSRLAIFVGIASGHFLIFIGIIAALLIALKLNIGGIGDFMKSLWANIKGLTFQLGELGGTVDNLTTITKELGEAGKDLGDDFGEGLSKALSVAEMILLRKQMEQFGIDLQQDFLKGFTEIDIDMLNSAISIIKNYYNDLLALEQISVEEAALGMREAIESVAKAIEESRITGDVINIYDELKDKIGEVNAEMIQGLSAAQQKVAIIKEELELRRDAMEAAKNEYNAQRDYINFLTKTNKDVSIEITTTEKKRMWEIKAKIKEIRKANLEEIQAEKRKMFMLAKTAADTKDEFNLKEEELKIAKELLRIEQKIVQLRLGLLNAIRAGGVAAAGIDVPTLIGVDEFVEEIAGMGDVMGDIGGVEGVIGNMGSNFEELGNKLKKLWDVVKWVGAALLVSKFLKALSAITKALKWLRAFGWTALGVKMLGLVAILKKISIPVALATGIYKIWKAGTELSKQIDATTTSWLNYIDMLNEVGKHEEALAEAQTMSKHFENYERYLRKLQLAFIPIIGWFILAWEEVEKKWGINLGKMWQKTIKGFRILGQDIQSSVANTFDSVILFFAGLPEKIKNSLSGLGSIIWSVFSNLPNFLWAKVNHIINIIAGWFFNLVTRIGDNLSGISDSIYNAIASAKQKIILKIIFFIEDIIAPFKEIGRAISRFIKAALGISSVSSNTSSATYPGYNNPYFQTGGIIAGRISQAVPIVAHGREMILNMGQQSKLFDLLSGVVSPMQYQPATAQQTTVNYNINFEVGNMICSPAEKRHFARSIQKSLEEDNRRIGPRL